MKKTNPHQAVKESEPKAPTDLRHTLASDPLAKAAWNNITPIARRDFISWIDSAKQPETRQRRVEVTCSKLASGKRRPCCYAIVPMNLYKALGENPKAKAQWKTLTPDAHRDFANWIDSATSPAARKQRVEAACAKLAAGEQHP